MKMKRIVLFLLLFLLFMLPACSQRKEEEEPYVREKVTVEFVTDGTAVNSVTDKTIETIPLTEKEGFLLEGWYETSDFSSPRVSFPYYSLESIKLYAKWIDKTKGNDEIVFTKQEDDSYEVTRCDTTCPIIWIPDEKDGKPVNKLAEGFLRKKNFVTFLHIGKNVTTIDETFFRCNLLTEIEVEGDNTHWTSMDGILFSAEKDLLVCYPCAKEGESFVFPETVTNASEDVFWYNRFLKSITINKDFVSSYYAFRRMESLESIDVEEENASFRSIEGVLYSIEDAKLLLCPPNYPKKSFSIASGTLSIAEEAFSDCQITVLNINKEMTDLSTQTIPSLQRYTVEEGNAYFVSRDGVLFVDEGNTLYRMPQGKDGSYAVPGDVAAIGDFAFSLSALTKVTLPASVKEIGVYAFSNCHDLSEIEFEQNSQLEKIEGSAFARCANLSKVTLTGRVPPTTEDILFDSCPSTIKVIIPAYTLGLYEEVWSFCKNNLSDIGQPVTLYEINFDSNGGTPVSSQRGAYILSSPSTTRSIGEVRMCSDLQTKSVSGYRGSTVNVKYDDCNPFGMISGDFGAISDITKHTNASAKEETIAAFVTLTQRYYAFMDSFGTTASGTRYITESDAELLESYTSFYNKAMELYNEKSLVSFTKKANGDLSKSAVIGLNHVYAVLFGSAVDSSINFQEVISKLFGFDSSSEFMVYAQDLADLYAMYRERNLSDEMIEGLENGCFCLEDGSFVFPIAVRNTLSSTVLMYVILDTTGSVNVWVSDITAVLQAINFNSSYYSGNVINNELYCKNALFVTGENVYENYTFIGWYDNPQGTGDKIKFPYAVTEDVTLYAAWEVSYTQLKE